MAWVVLATAANAGQQGYGLRESMTAHRVLLLLNFDISTLLMILRLVSSSNCLRPAIRGTVPMIAANLMPGQIGFDAR